MVARGWPSPISVRKLKDTKATDILPTSALSRLEENLNSNRRRVEYMARQFDFLDQKLNDVAVRYACVKGFSLVPQFCPDASLRHQSDFDYLVDKQSLPGAQRVLQDAGYSLKARKANEFVFFMPAAGMPSPDDAQYEPHAPHAVELRLAFWDHDCHGVPLNEPKFSVDNIRTHRCKELVFPVLPDEDAFLLQVIHAFNHILTGWVRMSWLYEIGYFLNQTSTDALLWERVDCRLGDDPVLSEIVSVVTNLAAKFFGAAPPAPPRSWADELRPAVRIWIQNYARPWVFAKNRVDQCSLFSAAKLVLFLHQQYLTAASARSRQMRIRLLPWEQLSRRAHSVATKSSTNSGGRRRQMERMLIRFLFHVTAGLRYLWEIPHWRRQNRAVAHLTRSSRRDLSVDLVNTQRPGSTIPW